MYAASNEFHQAVANGNPQMALLIFKDAVFTHEDIDVDTGIEYDDNFNMEKDIAIGQTPSCEIRFALFNDDRLLNDYEFGEFTATIGVLIGTNTYTQAGSVMVTTGYATYIGSDSAPHLRRNGSPVQVQPNFPVKSLLGYDGKLWAFSEDGRYAVYNDATGANITSENTLNAFMRSKSVRFSGKGIYYNPSSRILFIYEAGERSRYEFVPLGVFNAERPNAPDQIRIDMDCMDRMQKFEKDMPTADELGISYPTTIGNLFKKLCDYVGVPYRTTTFINSSATIDSEPEAFKNSTRRAVLGWIAEAAASNLRFDRDGYLKFDWLKDTGQAYDESMYSEYEPYWYETQTVNKLYNRDTTSGEDTTVGNGDIGYLIQNNPLLT